jgi:hypothetical protein
VYAKGDYYRTVKQANAQIRQDTRYAEYTLIATTSDGEPGIQNIPQAIYTHGLERFGMPNLAVCATIPQIQQRTLIAGVLWLMRVRGEPPLGDVTSRLRKINGIDLHGLTARVHVRPVDVEEFYWGYGHNNREMFDYRNSEMLQIDVAGVAMQTYVTTKKELSNVQG